MNHRSQTPEYRAWMNMRYRCEGRAEHHARHYRDRGISVCNRWLFGEGAQMDGFECFLADVGPRPGPKYTLDRRNNDENYEPGNVRWVVWSVQNKNTRRSKFVKITSPLAMFAMEHGLI